MNIVVRGTGSPLVCKDKKFEYDSRPISITQKIKNKKMMLLFLN